LLIFDGVLLLANSSHKVDSFWHKIFSTFDLTYLDFNFPESVHHFWMSRSTGTSELSYEEIRRLSLYNPSSYKRKFTINLKKNFVLTKLVAKENAEIQSSPHSIDIELLPEGTLTLDFGFFSE
jgi:hypothetical protein